MDTQYGAISKPTQAELDILQSNQPGYGSRSRLEVAFNLVNATVGAGIIGLPFAIHHAGFFCGLALSVTVALLSQLGLDLLVLAGQRTGIYQFAILVEHVMGRPGFYFLNLMIVVQAGGACVSYYILIGDTLPVLISLYFPDYPLLAERTFVILFISLFCVFPLYLSRSIGNLARWSMISVSCLPIVLLSLIVRAPVYAAQHNAPLTWVGTDIFSALGIMAFAFACSQVALNNFLSQKDQSMRGWTIATTIASCISWCGSMAFAVIGYLSFGTSVQPNLFLNFPSDDLVVNVGRLALGLSMILTLPMAFYPAREAVQKLFGFETALRTPTHVEHYALTCGLTLVITTAGVTIQSLGKVYALIGGFAATVLAYILPAALYLATNNHTVIYKKDMAAGLLLVWGLVVMVFATRGVFQ